MRGLRPLLAVALTLAVIPGAAPASGPRRVGPPDPAYYRPVVVNGMTFPVGRSNWLSVIEFTNDWHDPRLRLIDGRWQLVGFHEGVDILAEEGTPVFSTAAGRVEQVGWTFYSGTRVGVRGTDGRYYFYAHLSSVAPGIEVGVPVRPGTVLGRVGNTGYGPPGHTDEFPPHLHFGIQDGATWVNPYPMVRLLYRRGAAATARAEERLAGLLHTGRDEAAVRLAGRLYAEV